MSIPLPTQCTEQDDDRSTLSDVRSQLLNRILAIFTLIALPAILAGAIQGIHRGWLFLPILYGAAYAPVPVCYLLRHRLNIQVRILGILLPMYLVGVAVLLKLGLSGAGIPILLTLSVLATVILGLGPGIIVLCLNLATVGVVGAAINAHWIDFDMDVVYNSIDPTAWMTAFFVFAMLSAAAVLISGIVQRHLETSLESANSRQKALEREILEREKAEEEQRKMEIKLRQAQKMEAVGRLAGGVAHDFNNMLSVILGRAEVALMSVDPEDVLYNDLSEIHQAASRSADLTGQLLAFSRKQVASPSVVNLNEAIEAQWKILKRLIGEEIEMEFHPDHELWNIRIDPSQLDQILTNLTVNARDAIAGIGKITLETSNVFLDQEYARTRPYVRPGEYVMLSFRDTGSGMDPETLEHIFEPFFTTKKQGEGIGLGLATVYGIVKQNNGIIEALSDKNIGTNITIYFPRILSEATESIEEGNTEIYKGTETILVVEDEKQVLDFVSTSLSGLGYNVIMAATPKEALAIVEGNTQEIHLMLTDVVMPGMNGKELESKVKVKRPSVKTLFMSGYTANIIEERGVLEDDVRFVQKPFSFTTLARKVRRVLDDEEPSSPAQQGETS